MPFVPPPEHGDLFLFKTGRPDSRKVWEHGTVATNVFVRHLHNFALNVSWLPWPVIHRQQWPKVEFKEKRAITLAELEALFGGRAFGAEKLRI